MAAQTISAWTCTSVNGKLVAQCTAYTDATNEVVFTKKTPKELNTRKPYTLIISADAAQDGAAAPVSIHVGYGEDFALAGTTARCTVTSGFKHGNIADDVGYAAAGAIAIIIAPQRTSGFTNVAAIASPQTVGFKYHLPMAPYHAYELYAADAATLLAHTLTFTIMQ
jgi:hypothetical protein